MPTYQYACTACDERLEAVQSFTDAPLTECPACGGALRKVFSAVGVVFKGSGFYKTDSRAAAKSGGTSGKDGKDSKGAGDAGGGGKSESAAPAASSGSSSGDKASGSGDKSSSKPAAAASSSSSTPASKSA